MLEAKEEKRILLVEDDKGDALLVREVFRKKKAVISFRKHSDWDPFNVTEDADFGIRASVKGYKVGVIDSTTYEEANSKLNNWLRPRSRWVKGYMQTFLVHNRHPIPALKFMGLKQGFGYNLLIGGTVVCFLVSPLQWLIFFYWLLIRWDVFDAYFALLFLMAFATFNLIFGNIAVIVLSLLSALPRKYYQLLLWALLSPIYWLLYSP